MTDEQAIKNSVSKNKIDDYDLYFQILEICLKEMKKLDILQK